MSDNFVNLLTTTLALVRELCVTDEEKQEFDTRLDETLKLLDEIDKEEE